VTTMASSVDYALRTGGFEPKDDCKPPADNEQAKIVALKRYTDAKGAGPERLVSGSDDFTLFLWQPSADKKPLARMTGHQQLINQVVFSPDTRLIASASFDKSVKLWCGRTGKYLSSLRGHVQAVYQVAWSADSRLLVSGSADSTLKVLYHLHFNKNTLQTTSDIFQTKSDTFHTKQDTFHFKLDTFQIK
jgi:ribosome assembly protein 4